jgi:hypothetical protein
MIGLMLRVKLNRCLSPLFKINIRVTPGSLAIYKQYII